MRLPRQEVRGGKWPAARPCLPDTAELGRGLSPHARSCRDGNWRPARYSIEAFPKEEPLSCLQKHSR